MFQSNTNNNPFASFSLTALHQTRSAFFNTKIHHALFNQAFRRNNMLPQFPQDIAIDIEIEEENQRQLSGAEAEQGSFEKMEIDDEDAMDWKPEDAMGTSSS